MTSYVLPFDPRGKAHESFTVPTGKKVYLSRASSVSSGTATVQDLLSLNTYVLPDGVTLCDTGIAEGTSVSLAFVARSNNSINSVIVEVISPRSGIGSCN